MRLAFPSQPIQVVLSNGQSVELRVYTGEVLGAEQSSVTQISGAVVNGRGSISSDTFFTGQLWLHADNDAKKSFVLDEGLPFTPSTGQRVSIITGFASDRPEKETNLAIHGYEYDATYWLQGDNFERALSRTGLIGQAWTMMAFVYAALFITIIGIPVALAIGVWVGSAKRRTFRDLRLKALAAFEDSLRAPPAA